MCDRQVPPSATSNDQQGPSLLQSFAKSLTRGPQYVVKRGRTEAGTQMERGSKDNVSFILASLQNFSVCVNFSGGLEDL